MQTFTLGAQAKNINTCRDDTRELIHIMRVTIAQSRTYCCTAARGLISGLT